MKARRVSSILLLSLLLAAIEARAADSVETYAIDGAEAELVYSPSSELLLSRSCFPIEEKKCEAYRALGRASLAPLSRKLAGGVNPGSALCEQAGGETVLGLDAEGNENGFCRFKDGSIVSSATLHAHARSNDAGS